MPERISPCRGLMIGVLAVLIVLAVVAVPLLCPLLAVPLPRDSAEQKFPAPELRKAA